MSTPPPDFTDWHRLFGLMLIDFFTDSPFEVETEKDMSIKQQWLDVVVLRKRRGKLQLKLPDGMDPLHTHNLITFKSHQEALDDWALKELTGHYVNYRKQLQRADEPMLPESEFRLYAVCSRYPHNLANEVPWEPIQEGVYQCRRGTDRIRVLVAGQLPKAEQNAVLHLFSASTDRLNYASEHYAKRSTDTSTLIDQLITGYTKEGLTVGYTMADFRRWYAKQVQSELTDEERLEGISPEARLKGLPPEERTKGLTPEQLVEALTPQERDRLRQYLETTAQPEKRKKQGKRSEK